jgi:hypothetical protein
MPVSCNERAHGPPMSAIPTPDVCRATDRRCYERCRGAWQLPPAPSPMTELEVVLARFGAAIAERERQRQGPPNRFRE